MSKQYVSDTVSSGKYFAQILPDDSGDMESPRNDDNLGTMVCFHRNYILGDVVTSGRRSISGKGELTFNDPEDFTDWLKENKEQIAVLLPLYLYDHSGISMSTGREYPYNDRWDSGQVGYIFVTKEQARKEYGWKVITPARRSKLVEYLRGEVKTYDLYLRGEVYGYKLFRIDDDFDPDSDDPEEYGEELESCWGYLGDDYIKQDVKDLITAYEKTDAEQAVNEAESAWLAIPAGELVAVC